MIETVKLSCREYGQGPPLVILHGLLGSGGNWHTLSSGVLSKHNRVVVADLRNHGASPHSPEMTYAAMASDVVALLDRLELPSAFVMGHSMGGKVAMLVATENPHRVNGLIVVDIAPRDYPPEHRVIIDAMLAVDFTQVERREDVDAQLASAIPDPRVRQFLMKNLRRDEGGYEWQPNLAAISANYEAISGSIDGDGRYPGPVLFVRGGRSAYVTDGDMAPILQAFPRAELKTVKGAGHWVHADAPEAFGALVSAFLTSQNGDFSEPKTTVAR